MKRLNRQQRCLLNELIDCINQEDPIAHRDEFPDWALDHIIWTAGQNMPGYMPESPYVLFLTEREARGYCRELEREEGFRSGGYVTDYMPITLREVLAA